MFIRESSTRLLALVFSMGIAVTAFAQRSEVIRASDDESATSDNPRTERDKGKLDSELAAVLSAAGFTGNIEQTFRQRLETNLGRPINPKLADLGRLLWFDKLHALHHDNTCGGCHSP